jgi:secreted trypsin-like serine protease
MTRPGKTRLSALMVATAAVLLAACGGGDDEEALPSAETMCGSIGLQPKVLNGANCGQPERSSVILLNVVTDAGAGLCSGTLITPNKILTAAHCLPAGTRRVLAGLWRADGSVVGVAASRWAVHPQFQRTSNALVNDAAVIVLSRALPNPTMGVLLSEPSSAGQSVFVAGWGAPGFDLAVGFATLNRVNETSIGFTYTGALSNSCNGDSGGPAYRVVGGQPALIGITSSGTVAQCGEGDVSLFTNVQSPAVVNFIRAQAPEAAYR